jgi:hypothetical protein
MSRAEYDTTAATGQLQPRLSTGQDMVHVSLPPDPDAYRAAPAGSVFAEFDVDDAQMTKGGTADWKIFYGPNSPLGVIAARRGSPLAGMPFVSNLVLIAVKDKKS